MADCERVISKTLPACVAFHKPSFLQQLKNGTLEPTMVNALLTSAARYVSNLFYLQFDFNVFFFFLAFRIVPSPGVGGMKKKACVGRKPSARCSRLLCC